MNPTLMKYIVTKDHIAMYSYNIIFKLGTSVVYRIAENFELIINKNWLTPMYFKQCIRLHRPCNSKRQRCRKRTCIEQRSFLSVLKILFLSAKCY